MAFSPAVTITLFAEHAATLWNRRRRVFRGA